MNFESILEHHLMDHRHAHWLVGGVDLGFSKHLAVMLGVSAFLVVALSWAVRSKSRAGLLARGAVEAIVLFIRDKLLHPIFHDATDTYLPYFLTLFFFILACNLAGLIPE